MADYGHELQFGIFVTPAAAAAEQVLELAQLADVLGLDLVTFQDHPYQPRFLDTWTLLSVVAARTSTVRVAPNVANLPLRQPFVLARSVASLDILSGGRVELGIGSGAFWKGIVAAGGPDLTPGQGVDALAEALEVIRAVWSGEGETVRHDGEHYRISGAKSGPPPVHPVEIWLGAYKRRMLALTGAKADGWLPSLSYAGLDELPAMNAAIDAAAHEAGRSPTGVRRLYNVNGSFGTGSGFLQGTPADWREQLAELALEQGFGTFILAADSPEAVQRFAEEVAPGVRELVEKERGRRDAGGEGGPDPGNAEPPAAAGGGRGGGPAHGESAAGDGAAEGAPGTAAGAATAGRRATPLAAVPTPDDGTRLSEERAWSEDDRPTGPAPDPDRLYTPDEQAAGQHLIDVHDGLRAELRRVRDVLSQVSDGGVDPASLRSLFNRMTIRQNHWTLGAFCQSYCRAVATHHTLEDRSVFPHLKQRDGSLEGVIERLGDEHETIAEILDRIDGALTALVAGEEGALERVNADMDLLSDALLSHLSYEERELVEPLARLGFQ